MFSRGDRSFRTDTAQVCFAPGRNNRDCRDGLDGVSGFINGQHREIQQFQVSRPRAQRRAHGDCLNRAGWFDLFVLAVGAADSCRGIHLTWTARSRPHIANAPQSGQSGDARSLTGCVSTIPIGGCIKEVPLSHPLTRAVLTRRRDPYGDQTSLSRSQSNYYRGAVKASSPCGVVINTSLSIEMGAAALLFSSPSGRVLADFPSCKFRTMAESVEKGVKSAPSEDVSGRAEILPGS